MGKPVSEVGEFGLIARLTRQAPPARPDTVLAIGDDAAVFAVAPGRCLLATCDAQVAGVHFLPDRVDPYRLGRRCAAVNASDIAAMGGRPTHFLVSLALPSETDLGFVEALYRGLAEEAARCGADLAGGNLSRSAVLQVHVTLLGEVAPGRLLRRSGARPGDRVLVTGRLGAAAAGLALLLQPDLARDLSPGEREQVLQAQELPVARLGESRAIGEAGGATAMIDVSDGLARDLVHLCEASGVGVRLLAAALPVDEATRRVARAAGRDPLAWALGGGEDYELLFTARPERAGALAERVRQATGTPVSVVGEVVPLEEGRLLVWPDGSTEPLLPTGGGRGGWVHFGR